MGGHALGRRGGDPHLVKDVRVLVELAVDELVERQRLDNVALKHDRGEHVVRRVVVEAVEGEVVRVALRVPAPRLIEGASCRRRLSAVAGVVGCSLGCGWVVVGWWFGLLCSSIKRLKNFDFPGFGRGRLRGLGDWIARRA